MFFLIQYFVIHSEIYVEKTIENEDKIHHLVSRNVIFLNLNLNFRKIIAKISILLYAYVWLHET